jgi:hypothetical protein
MLTALSQAAVVALAGLFAGVNGFAVASLVVNNCLLLLSVLLLAKYVTGSSISSGKDMQCL